MFNRTPLLYKVSQTKRKMEEKKISEQESLELINQMIEQTRRDSTVGSGNTFLIWGYVCMVVSLAVFVAAYTGPGAWGWLYLGIPVMGGAATLIAGRKKKNAPSTYTSKSINSIWACLAGVFAAYAVYSLGYWAEMEGWSGMFLLGLLLPGIGTYCTGTILKEELLKLCGLIGVMMGVGFLHDLCTGAVISLAWPMLMAVSSAITLVAPGHYLNYQSKKQRK